VSFLKDLLQIGKPLDPEQAAGLWHRIESVVFQNPRLIVGNKHGIDAGGQCRINV
jgi:hypothetical protein